VYDHRVEEPYGGCGSGVGFDMNKSKNNDRWSRKVAVGVTRGLMIMSV
jgi:hypothetical protein